MKIACLLLAAGSSTRMPGQNKLMLEVDGTALVRKTLEEILKEPLQEVVVVTGHERETIEQELQGLKARCVFNPDHLSGMHSSIKTGLQSLKSPYDYFFICLADQPYFQPESMLGLIEAAKGHPTKSIFTWAYQGQRGHPVLLSSKFLPEIMAEANGDYGLNYLLKRHPTAVMTLETDHRDVLIDVDTPEDYASAQRKSFVVPHPVEEFHTLVAKLHLEQKTFATATVIEVIGSASARTGSKAIFHDGKNLLGWVGGGCAERFISEQCQEAISEKATRVVLADLDDEIFGLGVACGGKMRVFIEPVLPPEIVTLPDSPALTSMVRSLTAFYGWNVKRDNTLKIPQTAAELMMLMAQQVAKIRHCTSRQMRLVKEVPATFVDTKPKGRNVTLIGRTRITEALARHFTMLAYHVRVVGPDVRAEDYPTNVQCDCLADSYDEVVFKKDDIVIIAGHTSQDPTLVERAIQAQASHVAMIGSFKRSVEVLTHLKLMNQTVTAPLFIPAGLDIGAGNPDEIALSVVAEIIALQSGAWT